MFKRFTIINQLKNRSKLIIIFPKIEDETARYSKVSLQIWIDCFIPYLNFGNRKFSYVRICYD